MFDFFRKADPERTPNEAPRAPRAVIYRGGQPIVLYDNVCAANYAIQHPTIQRCLRTIARAVQVVDWYAEAKPGKNPSARDVEDLTDLLNDPNEDMAASGLRYWLALSLAVYGRAPFKVGIGSRGLANGIYPLDAQYLQGRIDSRGRIESYEYGYGDSKQVFRSKTSALQSNGTFQRSGFAFEISTPTLSGNLIKHKDRLVPLDSVGGPAKVIESLMKRTLATACGHPNAKYIIWTEDNLTEDQLDEVDDYIQNHDTFGSRSGEVMFLRSVKLNIEKLDSDLGDIHSKTAMDDMTRMIFGAFGIPVALAGLGAADAAKFASNYSESRAAFYYDTVVPEYLSPIADGLTRALAPKDIVIKFDLDTIPALLGERLNTASKLKDVTFLSDDEKRELIGFKPRNGGQTDG